MPNFLRKVNSTVFKRFAEPGPGRRAIMLTKSGATPLLKAVASRFRGQIDLGVAASAKDCLAIARELALDEAQLPALVALRSAGDAGAAKPPPGLGGEEGFAVLAFGGGSKKPSFIKLESWLSDYAPKPKAAAGGRAPPKRAASTEL